MHPEGGILQAGCGKAMQTAQSSNFYLTFKRNHGPGLKAA
jgi:hypothetical protein